MRRGTSETHGRCNTHPDGRRQAEAYTESAGGGPAVEATMEDKFNMMLEPAPYRGVPGIYLGRGPAGPRACVEGTGLGVFELIRQYQNCDADLACFAECFHWLRPEQLRAALAYYHLYQAEIDAWLSEEDAMDIDAWNAETQRIIEAKRASSAVQVATE
jgi:uncharacterized protein (DUF433 family)